MDDDYVGWCWHPDCLDVTKADAVRLNIDPRPQMFTSHADLIQHARDKHGADLHLPNEPMS